MQTGSVVRSVAGHDKDKFYVVVQCGRDYVSIADGRLRKLERPKRKNVRHVRPTKTVLDLNVVNTDKRLREVLKPFNEAVRDGSGGRGEQEGGH